MVAYWIMRKYDIFQINSANLVNVRGAQTFNENPLARQSAGAVEVSHGQSTAWQLSCFLLVNWTAAHQLDAVVTCPGTSPSFLSVFPQASISACVCLSPPTGQAG